MFKVDELIEATKAKLISGKKDQSIRGISIDTRTLRPNQVFICIRGNNFDGHDFISEAIDKGASCIIGERKEKVPSSKRITFLEVKDTTKALGDLARFHRKKFNIPIITVTGSNGKTTAKDMVAWVLSRRFKVLKNEGTKNNHIGLPMTLLKLDSSYDFAVLEAGTNHPGEIEYLAKICLPNISIITNIGPAHLEYFKNLEGVFKEKNNLLEYLQIPRIAILNSDDNLLRKKLLKKNCLNIVFGFSARNQSDFSATDIKVLSGRVKFKVNKKYKFTLKTLGYYNIYNALAAIAVGRLFGLPYRDIAAPLETFKFPRGRLNIISFKGRRFIDDTYNANPASLKQALDVLASFPTKGRKIFVMGDMLELGSATERFHRQAGRMAAAACDAFITVGKFSKLAAQTAGKSGLNIKNIFTYEDSSQAGDFLFKKISPQENDIVLVKGSHAMKMEEVFKI